MSINIKDLNQNEREILIEEVANRMKDLIFMHARKKAADMLNRMGTVDEEDTIHFTYEIGMVGADLIQIIGRKRRDSKWGS